MKPLFFFSSLLLTFLLQDIDFLLTHDLGELAKASSRALTIKEVDMIKIIIASVNYLPSTIRDAECNEEKSDRPYVLIAGIVSECCGSRRGELKSKGIRCTFSHKVKPRINKLKRKNNKQIEISYAFACSDTRTLF